MCNQGVKLVSVGPENIQSTQALCKSPQSGIFLLWRILLFSLVRDNKNFYRADHRKSFEASAF